jgi:hypothetical protein
MASSPITYDNFKDCEPVIAISYAEDTSLEDEDQQMYMKFVPVDDVYTQAFRNARRIIFKTRPDKFASMHQESTDGNEILSLSAVDALMHMKTEELQSLKEIFKNLLSKDHHKSMHHGLKEWVSDLLKNIDLSHTQGHLATKTLFCSHCHKPMAYSTSKVPQMEPWTSRH